MRAYLKNIICEHIFLLLRLFVNGHTIFNARTNEGVKHTTWGVWSQGGNPNH